MMYELEFIGLLECWSNGYFSFPNTPILAGPDPPAGCRAGMAGKPLFQIPTVREHGFVNILLAVLFTSIVYFGQE